MCNQIRSFCEHGDELSRLIKSSRATINCCTCQEAKHNSFWCCDNASYTLVGTTGPALMAQVCSVTVLQPIPKRDQSSNGTKLIVLWMYVRAGFRPGPDTTEHGRAGIGPGSSEADQTLYKTFRAVLANDLIKESYICSCFRCMFVTQSENKQLVQRTVTPFVRCKLIA